MTLDRRLAHESARSSAARACSISVPRSVMDAQQHARRPARAGAPRARGRRRRLRRAVDLLLVAARRRRARPARGAARDREDAAGERDRARPRRQLQARRSSRRTRRPRRSSATTSRAAARRLPAGRGLHEHPPRRRDQPHAAAHAGGAARGDAGAPRHRRGPDALAAGAVHGDRDPEPVRAGGHLPAARVAARPLPLQDPPRLRVGRDRARRCCACRTAASRRTCSATSSRCSTWRSSRPRRTTSTRPRRPTT